MSGIELTPNAFPHACSKRCGWRFGFLTILPVTPANALPRTVTASFRWFPLVEFAIGAGLCLEDLAGAFS